MAKSIPEAFKWFLLFILVILTNPIFSQCIYNCHDGYGIKTYNNGNIYEGEWKHDQPHGIGIKTFADGSQPLEGIWQNGNFLESKEISEELKDLSNFIANKIIGPPSENEKTTERATLIQRIARFCRDNPYIIILSTVSALFSLWLPLLSWIKKPRNS